MKYLVVATIALLAVSMAVASVFAYYPLNITIAPQAPSAIFQLGSNANQPDLGGRTISVSIGANGTSASVTINPTYQESYYKDILRVFNNDTRTMNVFLVFTSLSNTLPSGSIVKLFVYDGAVKVAELDISSPSLNTPISIGSIAASRTWQIDIYVYIPEGTVITGRSYTASAKLVYTPSTETPPATPSSGR